MKKSGKKSHKKISQNKTRLTDISHNTTITEFTTSSIPNGSEKSDSQDELDKTRESTAYDPWQRIGKPKKKLSSPITLKSRLRTRRPTSRESSRELIQTSLHTHYGVRKSKRVEEAARKKLDTELVIERLEDGDGDGLEIRTLPEKGRAVFSTQNFYRGEFICEYAGELISYTEAKTRELEYSEDILKGCYMYYFKHDGVKRCIDATKETGRLGRLINHSRIRNNIKPRVVENGSEIYLCFFATRDLDVGEELLYDYGDRSRESIKNFPWLKT